MKESDFDAFVKMMIALCEMFNSQIYSPTALILQFETLKDFSLNQISETITRLIKTRKNAFIPTISELIEAIKQNEGIDTLTIEQQAEVQANKVLEFLKVYGRSRTPNFTDSITQRLMTGRWSYYRWAATIEEADLKWWRKDFIKAYTAISAGQETYDSMFFSLRGEKKQQLEQFTTGILKQIPANNNNIRRAA